MGTAMSLSWTEHIFFENSIQTRSCCSKLKFCQIERGQTYFKTYPALHQRSAAANLRDLKSGCWIKNVALYDSQTGVIRGKQENTPTYIPFSIDISHDVLADQLEWNWLDMQPDPNSRCNKSSQEDSACFAWMKQMIFWPCIGHDRQCGCLSRKGR